LFTEHSRVFGTVFGSRANGSWGRAATREICVFAGFFTLITMRHSECFKEGRTGAMEAPGEPKLRKRLIMKKLLAVLALSALAACGGDDAAEETSTDATTTTTESTMPVTDPAATTPMPSTMPMDSTGAAGTTAAPMDSAGGNTTPEGAETTTP
jgi:hypothetical protein